ncbi:MAG: hypothetical protein ABR557_07660 [Pyrinomonadaceae bacterium]
MKSLLILRSLSLLLFLTLLSFNNSTAQPRPQTNSAPSLAQIDRVRLREVFRLGDSVGDRVWPGWSKAPFAVLLVMPEYEFLVRHPKPSADLPVSVMTSC